MVFRFRAIAASIYDFFISKPLTVRSHLLMAEHMTHLKGSFLDVGCGTGAPLQALIPHLLSSYQQIIGIDLDSEYIERAQQRFKSIPEVNIYEMDFYKLNSKIP